MLAIAGGGLHQPLREVLSTALQRASHLNLCVDHAMVPLLHRVVAKISSPTQFFNFRFRRYFRSAMI